MKIQDPTTCESCLSLLTGIIIPKPMFPKEENFGFVLETSDAKILKSIAKQVSKGIAMTDRQYALVKRKLITYKDQFEKHDLIVSINQPYAGGFITRNYGNPSKGIETIQIEVNRSLYMDENKLLLKNIEPIQKIFSEIFCKISDLL